MITLLDGPAGGIALTCERTPLLLRITQNGITFRSLDGFADEPEETELIYVYRRTTRTPESATYTFIPQQPNDSHIRQTHSWRGWTQRQTSF